MVYDPNIAAKMDMAAEVAEQELIKLLLTHGTTKTGAEPGGDAQPELTARQLTQWMRKHYMAAGYKRLSRIMLEVIT